MPKDFYPRLMTAIFLAAGFLISYFFLPNLLSILLGVVLLVILFYEWPKIGPWWLTPFYPILPCVLLIFLNQSPHRRLILFIFIMCALFDTAGYIVGSLFGKHKITPVLSPGKSWEGLFAGITTIFIVAPLLMQILNVPASNMGFLYYIFILSFCFLAFIGDLLV